MTFRRRLIPTAALVVAIGASAAGAATAAAAGGDSGSGTAAGKAQKTASCKVQLPGGTFKKGAAAKGTEAKGVEAKGTEAKGTEAKGVEAKGTEAKGSGLGDAEKTKPAAAGGKGQVAGKSGGTQPSDKCEKKVETVGLDQIAAELGVSKAALVQALDAAKRWVAASTPTPGVAQFEQHLAGLLNVPVAKVAAALKPGLA